jgi:UTP--glucose-1-phosphate uridylyltransferase
MWRSAHHAGLATSFFCAKKRQRAGHAILKARPFTQDEPFVVLYGDDVIWARTLLRSSGRAYSRIPKGLRGIKEVSPQIS